ncbi:MAG: circularly permuted type 2 ATP-grasp protein [Rhodospirillaceae bacterium]
MTAAYDEMASGRGTLRPHWRSLMATVWSMPPGQLAEKQQRANALLSEADEFIAIYGDRPGRAAWSMDVVPLIIPEAEWAAISRGVAQRARLLEAVLGDLYGQQRLMAERRLPPFLVYGNPAFLRPLRGVVPAAGAPHLYLYAVDLVRMPDGQWRVLADRTQAPAGVGYAIRNRRVEARTFPEAFRAASVRRLQPFTDRWRASLQAVGAALADDPRIVLLTPGPYNNAYFEHVYLARELGITLAQGSDLTVRGDQVFLKTLEGLTRVHVVYRRLDGAYCDPAELRDDSTLGVAGLVQAARAGTVAILNMPGTALVETPAFAPFLPGLARTLLDEELALPAVTTWWCGQAQPLAEVLNNLDGFVIRTVFNDPAPIDPRAQSRGSLASLRKSLVADPHNFVAFERVEHGVAPSLGESGLVPQPIVLRVSALWHEGGWHVMPGGLARVATAQPMYRHSLDHGGIAKDVWVLNEDEREGVGAVAVRQAPPPHRADATVQSRAADDLFWLGRYVERLDTGARLFRATLDRLAGGGLGPRDIAELTRLARVLDRDGWIESAVSRAPVDSAAFARGIAAAVGGDGAVRECIGRLRELGFAVRDRISLDMTTTLNHLIIPVHVALTRSGGDVDRLIAGLQDVIRETAAFAGLAAENMTRGAGWRFLDLGRRIERGGAIARSIAGVMEGHAGPADAGLRLSLELCDSTITYRMRYPTEARPTRALELVLADTSNPRALLYQLERIREHLLALHRGGPAAEELRLIDGCVEAVAGFPFGPQEAGDRLDLVPLLDLLGRTGDDLMMLSDAITRTYFSHVQATRTLSLAAVGAPGETAS